MTTANDGFAAMAELERAWHRGKPYDIVFLDQMMPGMSGDELAGRIRGHKFLAETSLVMVSSVGRDSSANSDKLKLEAVLEKPVRHQELLDTLVNIYSVTGEVAHPRPVAVPKITVANPEKAKARLRILLAEDNKINQQYAAVVLNKAGHHVKIAENGHQAVDAVRRGDFDVVLMDIQMPELDGIEATRQIRGLPAPKNAMPIFAMTAHAMRGVCEEYLTCRHERLYHQAVPARAAAGQAGAPGRRRARRDGLPAAARRGAGTGHQSPGGVEGRLAPQRTRIAGHTVPARCRRPSFGNRGA